MDAQARGASAAGRRVVLAGATGLVGTVLLTQLLRDPSVASVTVLARRPLPIQAPNLRALTVDFQSLPPLAPCDEVLLALGTTIKVAGSQPAFRAVDFDANLAVARAARAAGARACGLVSAKGADARSPIFYSRVKGDLELALEAMDWDALVIAQPSLLAGDRAALGQPGRSGEGLFLRLLQPLGGLLPAGVRPIEAAAVARALLATLGQARGTVRLSSAAMQRFA